MSCVRFRKVRKNIDEFIGIAMKDLINTDPNSITEDDLTTLFSLFEKSLVTFNKINSNSNHMYTNSVIKYL